jgi:hypothetical protein
MWHLPYHPSQPGGASPGTRRRDQVSLCRRPLAAMVKRVFTFRILARMCVMLCLGSSIVLCVGWSYATFGPVSVIPSKNPKWRQGESFYWRPVAEAPNTIIVSNRTVDPGLISYLYRSDASAVRPWQVIGSVRQPDWPESLVEPSVVGTNRVAIVRRLPFPAQSIALYYRLGPRPAEPSARPLRWVPAVRYGGSRVFVTGLSVDWPGLSFTALSISALLQVALSCAARARARFRRRRGECARCRYALPSSATSRCPECGYRPTA